MAAPPRPPAIEVAGLRKSFGDQTVLDGINLRVDQGEIFSLLGPNGAGKTTMVQILSTLIRADGGSARVAGHDLAGDPGGVRAAIGVTGQHAAVDKLLTGAENLALMADLHHLRRAEARRRVAGLLERFDLSESAGKLAATYSGGMTRRLDLAMTLVGEPRVLFLDEPTTGLDPRGRRAVHEIVRDLAAGGAAVFLTTQHLEEADELADQVALLDRGRLAAQGTPEDLKRMVPGGHVRLRFPDPAALGAACSAVGAGSADGDALTLTVPSDGSLASLRSLLACLDHASVEIAALSLHSPDLDDVFLTLTGRPAAQPGPEPAGAPAAPGQVPAKESPS